MEFEKCVRGGAGGRMAARGVHAARGATSIGGESGSGRVRRRTLCVQQQHNSSSTAASSSSNGGLGMIPSDKKKARSLHSGMFRRPKDDDDAFKASVSMHAALDLMPCSLASTLTLTPGRTRNLDQDMQALRLSRQDNPFLQLIASRESLLDADDCNDAAILMSNEHLVNSLELDPLSLPEIHEHMIRSPPPINWPRSPNSRVFRFPGSDYDDDSSQESLVGRTANHRPHPKSPTHHHPEHSSPKRSRSVMDGSSDYAERSLEFGVMGNRMTGRLSLTPKPPRRCSSDARGPFSILNAPRRVTRDEEELLVGATARSTPASMQH